MLMHPHEARLTALRAELARQHMTGFVLPISDEHMSEYIGAYAQRLAWLTGFGGSAGTAVVLAQKAAILVDGRYTLQVADEVDGRLYAHENVPATSPAKWLAAHVTAGDRIGYDPWLHSRPWAEATGAALAKLGATLVAPALAGPRLRPAAGTGGRGKRDQARRRCRVAGRTPLRRRHHFRARWRGLAAQYQGQRCRTHPGRARLCHRPCRRQRRSVHRSRKSHTCPHNPPRPASAHPPARGICRSPRRAGRQKSRG